MGGISMSAKLLELITLSMLKPLLGQSDKPLYEQGCILLPHLAGQSSVTLYLALRVEWCGSTTPWFVKSIQEHLVVKVGS